MRKKSYSIYIFILAIQILFISCDQRNNSNKTPNQFKKVDYKKASKSISDLSICTDSIITLNLDLDNLNQDLYFDELVEKIKFIKLENTKNGAVGDISKVVLFDNKIFIADYIFSQSLNVFDSNLGKHLFSLNTEGKGPNEFISMRSFTLDKNKKNIIIKDDRLSKLVIFDFNGKAITSNKINFRFNEIEQLSNDKFLFHTYRRANQFWPSIKDYSILIGELNGEINLRGAKYAEEQIRVNFTGFNSFTNFKNKLIYNYPLSNAISEISEQCIKTKYFIDFGKRNLPEKFDYNIDNRTFSEKFENKNSKYAYIYPEGVFENEKVLFFKIFYKSSKIPVFYFKKSKKLKYSKNIIPNYDNFVPLGKYVGKSEKGEAIFYLSALKLVKYRKYLKSQNEFHSIINTKVGELLKDIKEQDNGVLFFYNFKDI